ncbi:MAG TPA: sulfatase-like hydrolase/transferase [Anaerolineales bacterium]|nr:hypothetical protein [Anaerolineae bacterium]HRJ56073.1 sulfatase-like hydrolase/transferase [Anaerolineales bacterium]HRK91230.1 sulfatase-like hydrolase/transferase [Anaerolineales bacterium]
MNTKRLSRRDFLRLSLIAAGGASLAACDGQFLEFLRGDRPNFLIILTDDQRADTIQYMPRTKARIFEEGVTFEHGYATTPICGPSRRSLLTGMYAHTHGTLDNAEENFEDKTFIDHLADNGYFTGLVGKYANTWNGTPRPEFDYWVSIQNGSSRYLNPRLNVNGEWSRHQGEYITDAFGRYALEFIEIASRKTRPFCLFFCPNAPHDPATPAEKDAATALELPEKPPSYNEADISDKPNWLANIPPMTDADMQNLEAFKRDQILSLFSLDRAIDALLTRLDEEGLLDTTAIFFLSDNGKLWGEHRWTTKNSVYEESARIPFALRYPPLTSTPSVEERVVANIDIAPTVYELADIPSPEGVEGESLVDLLTPDGTDWREGILIEGWPGRGFYSAYHMGDYVYVETRWDKSEFYDLKKDPYQLENAIDDPEYQTLIEHMRAKLAELKREDIAPSESSDDETE